jgi:hypothetical protein
MESVKNVDLVNQSVFQTDMENFKRMEVLYHSDCCGCLEYKAYHDIESVHYGLVCILIYFSSDCPCRNCLVKVKCSHNDCEKHTNFIKEKYGL